MSAHADTSLAQSDRSAPSFRAPPSGLDRSWLSTRSQRPLASGLSRLQAPWASRSSDPAATHVGLAGSLSAKPKTLAMQSLPVQGLPLCELKGIPNKKKEVLCQEKSDSRRRVSGSACTCARVLTTWINTTASPAMAAMRAGRRAPRQSATSNMAGATSRRDLVLVGLDRPRERLAVERTSRASSACGMRGLTRSCLLYTSPSPRDS